MKNTAEDDLYRISTNPDADDAERVTGVLRRLRLVRRVQPQHTVPIVTPCTSQPNGRKDGARPGKRRRHVADAE